MTLPNELHPGLFSSGGAADLGEPIGQSLRFASSGYLTRGQSAPLIAADRTFTFSTWFKLGRLGESNIFGIHHSGTNENWLLTYTTETFQDRHNTGGSSSYRTYDTSNKFRDPSAWYHLFLTCESNVLTLRVNNVLQDTPRTQASGMDRDFWIGSEANGGSPMQGYLAETYFIQGTVLDAVNDGFIRLNNDGVYVPDTPTISSYGTNGWHLTYDPTQTNGVGHDSSGNGNHFTASGFDLTPKRDPGWETYASDWGVYYSGATSYVFSGNATSSFDTGDWYFVQPSTANIGGIFTEYGVSSGDVLKFDVYPRLGTVYLDMNSGAVTNSVSGNSFQTFSITVPSGGLSSLTIRGDDGTYWGIGAMYVNNVMLTNGSGFDYDMMLDSPTSNYATGNPIDALTQTAPNFTYNSANLAGTGTQNGLYHGLAGFTISLNDTNNYYWEIKTTGSNDGSYPALSLYQCWEANGTNWTDKLFLWYRNGQRYWDGTTTGSGLPTWQINDICSMRFDGSNNTVYCSVNGGSETAYTLPSRLRDIRPGYLCPPQNNAAVKLNFGQIPFEYQPANSVAMQTSNLPNPTIKDGSDHFRAIIAGPTTTVDSGEIGGDFSPYVTSNTGAWYGSAVPAGMFDGTLSGYTQTNDASATSTITFTPATPIPYTSSVEIYFGGPNVSLNGGANQTPAINQWSSIASGSGTITSLVFTGGYGGTVYGIRVDGNVLVDQGPLVSAQAAFPTGFYWIKDRDNSSTQHQLVDTIRGTNVAKLIPQNGSQTSYSAPTGSSVAWCWKSGAASKNGFNMFQYTGNPSSTQAIAHGLPDTPEFIISFSQSANSGVAVHHTKLPSGEILNLDSSAAPTSSTRYSSVDATNITFGGDYNTDGENYMCYAWTSIDAYSRIDSYKGNQSADGPFIYLGFKPSWILLKRGDIANWRIFDSSRNQTNPMDLMLWPNLSDAEGTDPYGSGDVVDFLSNGFKIRATGTTMNASNDHIYYVAFAESPFGGANVPPATAR